MIIFSLQRKECQFKFHSEIENEVRKVILNKDGDKANLAGDIPGRIHEILYLLKFLILH